MEKLIDLWNISDHLLAYLRYARHFDVRNFEIPNVLTFGMKSGVSEIILGLKICFIQAISIYNLLKH